MQSHEHVHLCFLRCLDPYHANLVVDSPAAAHRSPMLTLEILAGTPLRVTSATQKPLSNPSGTTPSNLFFFTWALHFCIHTCNYNMCFNALQLHFMLVHNVLVFLHSPPASSSFDSASAGPDQQSCSHDASRQPPLLCKASDVCRSPTTLCSTQKYR